MPRLNEPAAENHPWRRKSCTSYAQMADAKKKPTPRSEQRGSPRWACPSCGMTSCEFEECLEETL